MRKCALCQKTAIDTRLISRCDCKDSLYYCLQCEKTWIRVPDSPGYKWFVDTDSLEQVECPKCKGDYIVIENFKMQCEKRNLGTHSGGDTEGVGTAMFVIFMLVGWVYLLALTGPSVIGMIAVTVIMVYIILNGCNKMISGTFTPYDVSKFPDRMFVQ